MRAALLNRGAWKCVRSVFSKSNEASASHRLVEKARRVPDQFGTLSPVANQRWSESVLKTLDDVEEDDDVETVDFLDRKERTRLRPIEYARTIKTLLNEKKLKEALDVLENRMLKKEKAKPDMYIYNLLISGCARNGDTKKAFQLFNQMKKRGLRVRESTYTSLFNACSMSDFKEDALNRAIKLRELMLEKGHSPNQTTCHAMIKAYGRCGDVERAFAVVDEMVDRGLALSTGTFNFLLQSCVSNRESGFRMAIDVWSKMMKAKLKPSLHTFNLVLRCVRDCRFGQLADLDAHEQEIVVGPNVIPRKCDDLTTRPDTALTELSETREALIKRLRKPWNRLDLLGGREGFLKLMNSASIQPDIKTFTLLLDVLPPSTQIEDSLIEDMKKNGVNIDTDFCNLLIRKRSLSERRSDAKKVLDLLNSEKLKPNIMTYGVLALSCTNLRESKQLLRDIEEAGFRVNIEIMGGLIRGACQSWDFLVLRYLLQELIKQELTPNEALIRQLEDLKDQVHSQLNLKVSGGSCSTKLTKPNFIDEWQTFEGIIDKLVLLRPKPNTKNSKNQTGKSC